MHKLVDSSSVILPITRPSPSSPTLAKIKVAATKAKKQKNKGGAKAASPDEMMKTLKELEDLVNAELGKARVNKVAATAIKTILAAKDGLPFIGNETPIEEVAKEDNGPTAQEVESSKGAIPSQNELRDKELIDKPKKRDCPSNGRTANSGFHARLGSQGKKHSGKCVQSG